MSNAKTGAGRRPRLSIMSLLLLTTCVALGIQLWRTHQRADYMMRWASRLDYENRRLRNEYGEFEVKDRSLFYASQIGGDSIDESYRLDWKWRVYLPGKYLLRFADGGVSKKGFPKTADLETLLEPGYHTVRLHYWPDVENQSQQWRAKIHARGQLAASNYSHESTCLAKDQRWPPLLTTPREELPATSAVEGVGLGFLTVRSDRSQLPDQPVVLQRLIVQPGPHPLPHSGGHAKWLRSLPPNTKTPGFLIWLEPAP